MEIILKVLTMYGIAFCIAMFVAFIIWVLYQTATSEKISKIFHSSTYVGIIRLRKSRKNKRS